MLILAGVSLNAIIGDNGIITNSMNAKMQSGVAALEEYLQEKYVEYYDEAANYDSKVEFLNTKISNLLLKDGKNNYIVKGGQAYYLLNKAEANLPKEIKDGLVGGDASDRLQYIRMQDVYGITNDLKVYYCDGESNVTLGEMVGSIIDPNSPSVEVNKNTKLGDAVTAALSSRGITVDSTKGITVGNVASLPTLTIDGNDAKYKLDSLSGIEELTALRELTLINQNLSNLNGIENCIYLEYIYFDNCTIEDYSKLATAWNLKKLYIRIPASTNGTESKSQTDSNDEIARLSTAMTGATKISKLQYLGIFGLNRISSDEGSNLTINEVTRNNLSSIEGLSSWAGNIKSTVRFLYLNNNNLSSVSSLSGYSALYEVYLFTNPNLTSIESLANHTSLKYLTLQNCNVSSIESLSGCTNLYYLSVWNNSSLASLDGIATLTNLASLRAYSCSLTDITALKGTANKGLAALRYIQIEDNSSLEHADSITYCTSVNSMYLHGCDAVLDNDIKLLFSVVKRCGMNYSLPEGKEDLFDYPTTLDYTYSDTKILTDTHELMAKIKGNTELTWLRLYNQAGLGSSRIGSLLQSGDLAYSELATIKTNLRLDATGSEALLLDYYIELGEDGIETLSSSAIEAKEDLSDLYFRYILSTCSNLKQLSVYGITNLTKIDFLNMNKSCIEALDLRLTHIFDLEVVNQKRNSLKAIYLDGTYGSIDMSKIQELINKLNASMGSYDVSVYNCGEVNRKYMGLNLHGDLSNYNFSNCTKITRICLMGVADIVSSGNLDLSPCTSLSTMVFAGKYNNIVLPAVYFLSVLFDEGDGPISIDFSSVLGIDYLRYDGSYKSYDSLLAIPINRMSKGDGRSHLNFVGSLSGAYNSLTILDVGYGIMDDLSNLSPFNVLTTFRAAGNRYRNYTDFSGLNNTHITNFTFSNQNISDVSGLSGLPNVAVLNLSSNLINNQSGLSMFPSLVSLTTLNLSYNSIEDLAWLDDFVHTREDGKQYTNLITLDLSYNILLESTSSSGTDNAAKVQMLRDLGCTVITTGTNIGI